MVGIYTYLDPFLVGRTQHDIETVVHEVDMVDRCLIGYQSFGPDGWVLASMALTISDRLGVLLAHRPGVVHPAATARMAATLSAASDGRLALHVVTGGAPGDQYREGDYLPHDDRYRRSTEYVDVLRRIWSATGPLSFEGEFFRAQDICPGVKPHGEISIHMGGASPAALEFGGRQADVYMLWGEPVDAVRQRISDIRAAAAAVGRPAPAICLSLRLYVGSTDAEARELARSEPDYQRYVAEGARVRTRDHAEDAGRNRQLGLARDSEWHDDCLWMGIVAALNGLGNAASLVGTEDRILASLQSYADLGVDRFLVAGTGGYWRPDLVGLAKKIKDEVRPAAASPR